ncbi:MAG: hypothetical protein WKF71_11255 [Pyrinomonadaceae bacterium]
MRVPSIAIAPPEIGSAEIGSRKSADSRRRDECAVATIRDFAARSSRIYFFTRSNLSKIDVT